jgi:hypothetical protein
MSAAERRAANNKLIKENNDQLAALKADIEAKRPMDTLRSTMVNLPNKPPPKKNEDKLKLVQKKLLQVKNLYALRNQPIKFDLNDICFDYL